MQRRSVRHWSERGWKKPRNTPGSFACFFQAFAAQLIAEIHSSYLTDSGKTLTSVKTGFFPHFFLRFLFSLPFCFAASLAAEEGAGQGDIIQAIQRAQEQSARERAEKESGKRGETPKKFDSVPRWDAPGVPHSTAGGPLADFVETVVTSDLANPVIQGGQTIGRITEAVERNDAMAGAIEGADATGKLGAIGVGAQQGALIGAPLGPVGSVIGGMVGGFLGKTVWNYTGGQVSDYSRRQHEQNQARQKKETLLS